MLTFLGLSRSLSRVAIVAVLALGSQSWLAATAQTDGHPLMNNVDDVTGGATYLYQVQDASRLVVSSNNGVTTTTIQIGKTADSKVTSTRDLVVNNSTGSGAFDPNAGRTSSEATGRVTDSSTDILAVFNAVDNVGLNGVTHATWALSLINSASGKINTVTLPASFDPAGTVNVQIVMGDFNGDHLSDALVYYSSQTGSASHHALMAITADKSSTDPLAVKFGPEYLTPSPYGAGTLVVGDFNGDTRDEAAMLQENRKVVDFFTLDPGSLTITSSSAAVSVTLPHPMVSGQVALAAGRFREVANADLVVFGQIQDQAAGYSVIPVHITPSPAADGTFTTTLVTAGVFRFPDYSEASGAMAQAAPLIYWPQLTNAVLLLGIQTKEGSSFIEIGGFSPPSPGEDPLSTFGWYSETRRNDGLIHDYLVSLQAGNFDHQGKDSLNQTIHNPTLQVQSEEILYNFLPETSTFIFNVNVPQNFIPRPDVKRTDWLKKADQRVLDSNTALSNADLEARPDIYIPSDTQGRSLRLGSPLIFQIDSQIQPDFVLGMPPMHVDYVTPFTSGQNLDGCGDGTKPCIANISFKPTLTSANSKTGGFKSQFTYQSSQTHTGTSSTTTSWGLATSVSIDEQVSSNDALANASEEFKQTINASYQSTVEKQWGNYQSSSAVSDISTGASDRVLYTSQSEHLYYYPILGCENSSMCPKDSSGKPTYVIFSVPDNTLQSVVDGSKLEWYQPIQEPGELFSYPWDSSTLQRQYASTVNPVNSSSCTTISTGDTVDTVSWKNGQNSSTTTGWTAAWGTDSEFSLSAGVGVKKIDSAQFTTTFDFSYNQSIKSMNKSATAMDSSLGIGLAVPDFDTTPQCCSYGFSQKIFNLQDADHHPQTPCAGGVTQNCVPLNFSKAGQSLQLALNGPLFNEFIASVRPSKDLGCSLDPGFWGSVYTVPDVALNHPSRWNYRKSTATVSFSNPDNSLSPLRSPFYEMKGFFITKHDTTVSAPGGVGLPVGPVLEEATTSDVLNLTTRVYNYSLVDTTGTVYVRTYAQKYCSSDSGAEQSCLDGTKACASATLCGAAFQIGTDQTIAKISGFQSGNDPNWQLSTVLFDPQAYSQTKVNGITHLVFWVVVWMQDANGKLVAEMPFHGMTSIPSASITQIDQEPFDSYSNNVGLYGVHSQFTLFPKDSAPGATQGTGTLETVTLSTPTQTGLDTTAPITSTIKASGSAVNRVQVAYYDGDPAKGGSLFDLQQLSYLQPGSVYTHSSSYQATSCGIHTLFAVASSAGTASAQAMSSLNVTLDPKPSIQALIQQTQSATFTDPVLKTALLTILNRVANDYNAGQSQAAEALLSDFLQQIGVSGTTKAAMKLASISDSVLGCGSKSFYLTALQPTEATSGSNSASYALALTPTGSFAGTVALTCSVSAGATCTLSTTSTTLMGGVQQPFTATVSLTPPSSAGIIPGSGYRSWLLALLFFGTTLRFLGRRKTQPRLLLLVVSVVLATAVVGCGGPARPSSTRSVSVLVSATSGANTQSLPLTLQVP